MGINYEKINNTSGRDEVGELNSKFNIMMRMFRTNGVFFDCVHTEFSSSLNIHLLAFRNSQAVHKSPIKTVENDKCTGKQEP